MPYAKNPDSNRSKKRANRNFTKSRPERRAERRLSQNLGAYNNGAKMDSAAYTTPGKQAHW